MSGVSNWSIQTQGLGAAGTASNALGAGGDPVAVGTGAQLLDALRRGSGRTPEAEYPDNYTGIPQSSKRKNAAEDAILQNRLSDRSYQHGVHRATKMPASAYLWPADFGPDSGLKLEARGKLGPDGTILVPKFTPPGSPLDRYQAGMSISPQERAAMYQQFGITSKASADVLNPDVAALLGPTAPPMSW